MTLVVTFATCRCSVVSVFKLLVFLGRKAFKKWVLAGLSILVSRKCFILVSCAPKPEKMSTKGPSSKRKGKQCILNDLLREREDNVWRICSFKKVKAKF